MPRISAKEVMSKIFEEESNPNTNSKDIHLPAAELHASDNNFAKARHKKIPAIDIEPSRCRPWQYHNRDLAWLNKDKCADLIGSIRRIGQNEPALVRRVTNDPNYDFEIIYGVRRWYACSQIPEQKLLARITQADDKNCMIMMHAENADSNDITEFERAYSFSQQMKSGVFLNQTDMAESLGLSQGLISRMIRAAELFSYPWLQRLFKNKLDVKIKPAYELIVLLSNKAIEEKIKEEAAVIQAEIASGNQISSASVLKRLYAIGSGKAGKNVLHGTLLKKGSKDVIHYKKTPKGKVTVIFEPQVKFFTEAELKSVLEKVLLDTILKK